MTAISAAVQHVQTIRNQREHEYLAWYVDRFTDEDPAGKTTEQLREIMVADDWGERWCAGSSEDEATSEAYEAEIQTLDSVLDVIHILAHGGKPEQGSRVEITVACGDDDDFVDAATAAVLDRLVSEVAITRITECGGGYVEVETTDGQCFGVLLLREGEPRPGDVVYVEGASAMLGDVCAVERVEESLRATVAWRAAVTEEDADDLIVVESPAGTTTTIPRGSPVE